MTIELRDGMGDGPLATFTHEDGRVLHMNLILSNRVQLCLDDPTTPGTYSDVWTYRNDWEAYVGAVTWLREGGDEPDGWLRHQPSNRRRPGGVKDREYVAP